MAGILSVARLRDLIAKYGKVALGVHLSVSAASITGCYVAIKNNVDVGAVLQRVGLFSDNMEKEEADDIHRFEAVALEGSEATAPPVEDRKSAVHAAVSGGGALALAFLCNKALMPVRIPITVALTPTVARLLARRNLYKSS